MLKRPVQEMFQIMCLQRSFDTPLVLCAAFISLFKHGFSTPQIVQGFERLISTLNGVAYDLTLQELAVTAVHDVAAVEALQIAVGSPPAGMWLIDMKLIAGDDLDFVFAKVLFQLTRNILLTSSSDAFIGMLRLVQRILREKVIIRCAIVTNLLAEIDFQVEFGSFNRQSHNHLFSSEPSLGRVCRTRRNLRCHCFCCTNYSATLSSSSYQEISSRCTDVTGDGSRFRKNHFNGIKTRSRNGVTTTAVANDFLLSIHCATIFTGPYNVDFSTVGNMAQQQFAVFQKTIIFCERQNRQSSIETCSVVHDGIRCLAGRIPRLDN